MDIHPILWGGHFEKWSAARPTKINALMDMLPPNNKREFQAFLDIIHYLAKVSPSTVAVCYPL